ncbi:MAG: pilus assembly protein [Endomicrobium sp.]|nr:pilus assembly protein [Endomicrobium sp.]
MFYFKCFKQSRGQALVEAALIVPPIILFLFTVIWFACVMLTWQQISTAARYGTDFNCIYSF